jgi:hypothetical protein
MLPRTQKWGYTDREGGLVIDPRFDQASPFSERIAPVQVGHRWGYVDHEGNFIIAGRFEAAVGFSEGLGLVLMANGATSISPGSFASCHFSRLRTPSVKDWGPYVSADRRSAVISVLQVNGRSSLSSTM